MCCKRRPVWRMNPAMASAFTFLAAEGLSDYEIAALCLINRRTVGRWRKWSGTAPSGQKGHRFTCKTAKLGNRKFRHRTGYRSIRAYTASRRRLASMDAGWREGLTPYERLIAEAVLVASPPVTVKGIMTFVEGKTGRVLFFTNVHRSLKRLIESGTVEVKGRVNTSRHGHPLVFAVPREALVKPLWELIWLIPGVCPPPPRVGEEDDGPGYYKRRCA